MRRYIISCFFSLLIICGIVKTHSQNKEVVSQDLRETYFYSTNPLPTTVTDFTTINKFTLSNEIGNIHNSNIIQAPNGNVFLFWSEKVWNSDSIYIAKSIDGGLTWQDKIFFHSEISSTQSLMYFTSVVTNTGRLFVVFANHIPGQTLKMRGFYSDNNGETWSEPFFLGTGLGILGYIPSLSVTSDGKLWLFTTNLNEKLTYRTSINNGETWSNIQNLPVISGKLTYGSIVETEPGKIMLICINDKNIISLTSSNSGETWNEPVTIYSDETVKSSAAFRKDQNDNIWIAFQSRILSDYHNRFQEEIFYMKSSDNGVNWSAPIPFTRYVGFDGYVSLAIVNNLPMISFSSGRFSTGISTFSLWYGIAELSEDILTHPLILNIANTTPYRDIEIHVIAEVDTYTPIEEVKLHYTVDNGELNILPLFDDGMHNDGDPGDNIWGNYFGPFLWGQNINYKIYVKDINGNTAESGIRTFQIINEEKYVFDINYLTIPVDPTGVIGGFLDNYGMFDGQVFLFTGGFFLSGKKGDELWGNGIMTASRIADYQAGPVGSDPYSGDHRLYVVNNSDPHFGASWQAWSNAVNLGADFYDGDGDGIYNPVDKNGNGIWDPDEDRPDLIGNVTVWSVINDGVPKEDRRFKVDPQGIEIHQTFFAFGNTEYSLANTFFVRYRIFNKSEFPFTDVYFSIAADPDLGDYTDDLVGSDTLTNSGYVYNDGPDYIYGPNPPAMFNTILQGPVVYIPDETFIDINGNGIYDDGIDIPLDTAYNVRGPQIGIDVFPGAKNLGMNSFTHYMSSHPTHGDPNVKSELRNYQIGGLTKQGNSIYPCQWQFGVINGVNCNEVNPKYMYSGDPESNFGWLNNTPVDQRIMTNSGPFNLAPGESQDIIITYIVARGENANNSVTVIKQMTGEVIEAFKNNYPVIVGVDEQPEIVSDFKLYQNYPNPFNPSTVISYQLPEAVRVSLKIYDLLGREIASLVNEEKQAGNYEVTFDASRFSSGLYFYRLKTEKFVETKKMMVIK